MAAARTGSGSVRQGRPPSAVRRQRRLARGRRHAQRRAGRVAGPRGGRRPPPAGSVARRCSPLGQGEIRRRSRDAPQLDLVGPGVGVAAQERLGVGVVRSAQQRVLGWSSTIRPAYITSTLSVASRTTPRSWLIRIAVKPLSRWSSWIVCITAFCTITSRAVVGSSKTTSFGSSARARAIETRCRMPPDSSWGTCRARPPGAAPSPAAPRRGGVRRTPSRPRRHGRAPARCRAGGGSTLRTGLSAFMPLCSTSAIPLRRWARSASPVRLPCRCRRTGCVRRSAAPGSAAAGSARSRGSTCRSRTPQPMPTNSPCRRLRLTSRTACTGASAGWRWVLGVEHLRRSCPEDDVVVTVLSIVLTSPAAGGWRGRRRRS